MMADSIRGDAVPAMHSYSRLLALFIFAVAIRAAYGLALYFMWGDGALLLEDSYGYLSNAQAMAADILAGTRLGWQWFGRDLSTMPLYTWLVTLNVIVMGPHAVLATILSQSFIDAGTCLLVYGIARKIAPEFALPAGIAACINPTQIVLSGLLYTDTLFSFFVAASLLASLYWLHKPSWRYAAIIGLALGAAALTRVLVAVWTPVLVIFLLATLAFRRSLQRQHLAQMLVAGFIVALSLAPIVVRNVSQYSSWALTPQGGPHLALWVVPLVKEATDGTPWAISAKAIAAEFQKRHPDTSTNRFEASRRYRELGQEALAQMGIVAIAKAWVRGALINLASPAVIEVPPVSRLEHTRFYDAEGDSFAQKLTTYLFRSGNALYTSLVLGGITGLVVFRVVQLVGLGATLIRRSVLAPVLLLGLWSCYVLAVNGPVASPKYRLPIEPVLAVLCGAGFWTIRNRWKASRRTGTNPS